MTHISFFCLWSWCHIQKVSMKIENKKACKEANFGAWWSKQKPTVTLSFTFIVYFCWYSSEETWQKQSEAGARVRPKAPAEPEHSGFTTFAADPSNNFEMGMKDLFLIKKHKWALTQKCWPLSCYHTTTKKSFEF